jgi:signal peptidase II
MNYLRIFFSVALFVFLVILDQATKYIIRFFGGFYICNKGIAFGISLPNWLILGFIVTILVFAIFLILNFKFIPCGISLKKKISNLALIFILSGAISNLLDRLYNGCVIDFIDLKIWPVFNLADVFICLGVFLLVLKLNKK